MNGNMREKFEAWAVKTYQRSLADIELMDASLWPHWQIAYCTGKAERLRELAVAQERIAELTPDAERYREARRNPSGYVHLLRLMVKENATGEALDKMMDRIAQSRSAAIDAARAKDAD